MTVVAVTFSRKMSNLRSRFPAWFHGLLQDKDVQVDRFLTIDGTRSLFKLNLWLAGKSAFSFIAGPAWFVVCQVLQTMFGGEHNNFIASVSRKHNNFMVRLAVNNFLCFTGYVIT